MRQGKRSAYWVQMGGAWCGLAFLAIFFVGWGLVGGYLPPHQPNWGAEQVAAIYRENTLSIRIGLLMVMFSSALSAPWVAVLAVYMKKVEGGMPVLTYIQLGCGMLGVLVLVFPSMAWQAAAFRPERDAELILLLNDVCWLTITMTFSIAMLQNFALGTCILVDTGKVPVFPRWSGYFNIWVGILFLPAGLIAFFKSGPFAWNGLLGFWLVAAVFGIWFPVMFTLLVKAIKREALL